MRDDQNNNLLNVFLGIIAVFVLGVMLLQLKTVLMPFVIAVLLSIIFKPLILGLREKGIPMFASLFGVLLIGRDLWGVVLGARLPILSIS